MIADEIGRFWHRVHLSGYSDYAFCLMKMLPSCMLRNAVTKRVFMAFLLFLISGLIHQFTSWQLNPGWSDYADLQFFCMNAVAVTLESALLALLRRTSPWNQSSEDGKHLRPEARRSHAQRLLWGGLVRLVGYTWVMSFFVWAIPKCYYPRVYGTVNQQLQLREMGTNI